ncbi:cadmium-translocating P-type ATPase [Bacteroides sp. 519]|nr:cadmium-translocating P-type ATPase [Bacteroides sp. 519]
MLVAGLLAEHVFHVAFFTGYIKLAWYILAYLPVGIPVLKESVESISHKDFFNEFTLMTIATLGAFFIKEYPEGVAVMLFYSVGELFQDAAVNKAKSNIKALLDIRPDMATVLRDGEYITLSPSEVKIGETIQVKAGEKVPLDGILLSQESSFNTSALTGESKPRTIRKDETVLSGMMNIDKVIEVQVQKLYEDSAFSRILAMVQDATSRKAKTELLIRRFARIYTPIVFFLALAIATVPALFISDYVFQTWLYRALVFLVISCPCALVISIPLGYFGGIGAASRNGILFKGANYLDMMPAINVVAMDKTGTLTKGVFEVQNIATNHNPDTFMSICGSIESQSKHPIAKAILSYCNTKQIPIMPVSEAEEIAGHGIKGVVNNQTILAGNARLMDKYNVGYDKQIDSIPETIVIIAIDNVYAGYVTIADEVKKDAAYTISKMREYGIKTVMLSGDKASIVEKMASELSIDEAYGNLLPEDKIKYVERLKKNPEHKVAFVGDGINDAPVLALSDIGIAMGAMGSDAAIEIADVVIQTDEPSKIVSAIKISKKTRRIVKQNITMAFTVKLAVLILGTIGFASMWGAVFADVGVALLAILNAVRVLNYKEVSLS